MNQRILRVTLVVGLALGCPIKTAAAQVSDQDVDRLIVIGKANRLKDVSYACTAKRTSGGMLGGGLVPMAISGSMNKGKTSYDVLVVSNRGRIAHAAWNATQSRRPFARGDVPAEWLTDGLFVIVSPNFPDPKDTSPPVIPDPVSEVTLKTVGQKIVLSKSTSRTETPRTWKNAGGATVDYSDLAFTIDHLALDKAEIDRQAQLDPRNPDDSTNLILRFRRRRSTLRYVSNNARTLEKSGGLGRDDVAFDCIPIASRAEGGRARCLIDRALNACVCWC